MSSPLRLKAGDDITLEITAVKANGSVINLTSSTIIVAVFNSSDVEQFRKTTSSGVTITDETAGEFEVQFDAADTDGFDAIFKLEAEVTSNSGKKTTLSGADLFPKELFFIPDLIA